MNACTTYSFIHTYVRVKSLRSNEYYSKFMPEAIFILLWNLKAYIYKVSR